MSPQSSSHPPRLLALDTSTQRLAVAVVHNEQVFSATEEGGARASARLLPLALELLHQAGLSVSQLDAIAFGQGPGAFTGLRTAAAAAQGLALGGNKPVLALDSLALVAEDALPDAPLGASVWVAMDARMEEIYAGRYLRITTGWQAIEAPSLWPWQALAQHMSVAEFEGTVAGSALTVLGHRLPVPTGAHAEPNEHDRAAALARCARAAWLHGATLDASDALPLYLRDKVAQTTAERLAAKASA